MSTDNGQQMYIQKIDVEKVGCQLSVDLKKRKVKMKKLLVTFTMVIILGLGANAQSDSFFTSTSNEYGRTDSNQSDISQITPKLPDFGATSNEQAPVGSGLLLLAGMGVAYALRRKND